MDALELLQRCYGYSQFRPGQRELIESALGGRDVFGIMPTGGGKSMCYQIPAMLFPGITLVISPLISLMRDQVQALKAMGVPAAFLNSSLNYAQVNAVYQNLRRGMYKIIYVAPERLDTERFLALAQELPISFLAVDEAHCISQWGQDFRPSYLRILDFLKALPQRPVVGAFTATATRQVQEDIAQRLGLQGPLKTVTGFDRPNLYFEVQRPQTKDAALHRLLATRRDKSGIIYCATRKSVENVHQQLEAAGFSATRYHAGLSDQERDENQLDFLYDRKTIMVATNAFGMGIDKSNVSFVIHYQMPKSMEHYYQEAGRAGRDGAPAECILLYNAGDVQTAKFFIEQSSENQELTPEELEVIKARDYERLGAMVRYCKSKECLRGLILDYFGQVHDEFCGNCSNCHGEFVSVDITRQAQMILSCVQRIRDKLGYSTGASTVIQTLRGSKSKRILELNLHELSTYGLLKDTSQQELRQMVEHLEAEGYLVTEPEHQTVKLTAKARVVLFQNQSVSILVRKEQTPVHSKPAESEIAPEDQELFDALRSKRSELARQNEIPAYVIFSNATLLDMARKKPRSMSQFRRISGVGELKCQWYGKVFLEVIEKELENS